MDRLRQTTRSGRLERTPIQCLFHSNRSPATGRNVEQHLRRFPAIRAAAVSTSVAIRLSSYFSAVDNSPWTRKMQAQMPWG